MVDVRVLPPVPDPAGFAGAFAGVIGDYLVAGGGANFPDGLMPWDGGIKVWHDTLYALDLTDPSSGWWVAGKLPQPNGYGVSITLPNGVVFIGGGDAACHFTDTWFISLKGGVTAFKKLPDLPQPLSQMSGALVGNRIHLCGGITAPTATIAENRHWMLDLDSLTTGWQSQPELPAEGRILATAASLDGSFYFLGGCALAPGATGAPVRTCLRDAWKFSDGGWSRLADLPTAAVAAGSPAPVAENAICVVSGDDGKQTGLASPSDHRGFPAAVQRYDTRRDSWSVAGQLPVTPPVTVAVAPWRGQFIFFNGEIKPGLRTTEVFALPAVQFALP